MIATKYMMQSLIPQIVHNFNGFGDIDRIAHYEPSGTMRGFRDMYVIHIKFHNKKAYSLFKLKHYSCFKYYHEMTEKAKQFESEEVVWSYKSDVDKSMFE